MAVRYDAHYAITDYAAAYACYQEYYGHMDTLNPERFRKAKKHTIDALNRMIESARYLNQPTLVMQWERTLTETRKRTIKQAGTTYYAEMSEETLALIDSGNHA